MELGIFKALKSPEQGDCSELSEKAIVLWPLWHFEFLLACDGGMACDGDGLPKGASGQEELHMGPLSVPRQLCPRPGRPVPRGPRR